MKYIDSHTIVAAGSNSITRTGKYSASLMKWSANALFSTVLTLGLAQASPCLAQSVPGDVAPRGNPDGQLDMADLLLVQQFILGQLQPTADELNAADVAPLDHHDDALAIDDYLLLQQQMLSMRELPILQDETPPANRSTESESTINYLYYDAPANAQIAAIIENGPRIDSATDDVTVTFYDTVGNVAQISNALGQNVSFSQYNARGQAGSVTDANGQSTSFTYHPRGWLETITVHHPFDPLLAAVTTFDYDAVGQLTRVTLPNGVWLQYHYDQARRLEAISNSRNERMEYTLDNAGNRTAMQICDANTGGDSGVACNVRQQYTQVFDGLNRLRRSIGGTDNQTMQYDYNLNDNVQTETTPKSQQYGRVYDELNRVASQVMPDATPADATDNPQVTFTYDTQDRINTVTDERGLVTTYTYNAHDELTQVDSPDTGLTTYTYDEAGNRTSETNANGRIVYYRYDALNRVTEVVPVGGPGQHATYTYDNTVDVDGMPHYGIGRLTRISDASGETHFSYDHRGNIIKQVTQRQGITSTTRYAYNLADQVTQITYPSGRLVDYQRDDQGRVAGVTQRNSAGMASIQVANNIQYEPFGGIKQLDYGNGIQRAIQYDLDYRIAEIMDMNFAGPTVHLVYDYDLNSNIEDLQSPGDNTFSHQLTYDERDRLDTATGVYGSLDYDYDAVGNRTQATTTDNGQTDTDTYQYSPTSNRLDHISNANGTRQFTYDSAGNTIEDSRTDGTTYTLDYNSVNRYSKLSINDAEVARYTYNALGQRIQKTVSLAGGQQLITYYHYGLQGELLAETDGQGNTLRDYLYMDGSRLARVNSAQQLEYFHADHLNRPVALTDQSRAVVWQAYYKPFGEAHVVFNTTDDQELGFPGQILDTESEFYYNYFRDYDPSLGRYIQSDPIGLRGGINTYGYVGGNPVTFIDPDGLRYRTLPSNRAGGQYGQHPGSRHVNPQHQAPALRPSPPRNNTDPFSKPNTTRRDLEFLKNFMDFYDDAVDTEDLLVKEICRIDPSLAICKAEPLDNCKSPTNFPK